MAPPRIQTVHHDVYPETNAPGFSDLPKAGETSYLLLDGDQQYNVFSYDEMDHRSLTMAMFTPGRRFEGQNLGVFMADEALSRKVYRLIQKDHGESGFLGRITLGDNADISAVQEMEMYFETDRRLVQGNPRQALRMFVVGNHDAFHSGTVSDGGDLSSQTVRLLMHAGASDVYKRDFQSPEVGGAENVLDKEKFIRMSFAHVFGHEISFTPLRFQSSTEYGLAGQNKIGAWQNTEQAFTDFWHAETPDTWVAAVDAQPHQKNSPQSRFLYVNACLLRTFESNGKKIPLYTIGLDTVDFIDKNLELDATQGRMSHLQVKILKAFMDHMKSLHPGARFILSGHHRLRDLMHHFKRSGFADILSDRAVVLYVGAHRHKRDYADLNDDQYRSQLGIEGRGTSLPEITIPAVIDWKPEKTLFSFGLQDGRLDFKFNFVDLKDSPADIPHDGDAEVTEAYIALDHDINTFKTATSRIEDPQFKALVRPDVGIWEKIYLILNLDRGVATRPGHMADQAVRDDTLLAHAAGSQFLLKLFGLVGDLTLGESGLDAEAVNLKAGFEAALLSLNNYYTNVLNKQWAKHDDFHYLQDLLDRLTGTTSLILAAMQKKREDPDTPAPLRELLSAADHIVMDLPNALRDYYAWIQGYEKLRVNDSPADKYIRTADMWSRPGFRSILEHLHKLPFDSRASGLLLKVFLRSAEERHLYRPLLHDNPLRSPVPDIIEVTADLKTGVVKAPASISFAPLPDRPTSVEVLHARDADGRFLFAPGREAHWAFETGWSHHHLKAQTGNGLAIAIGGQTHLLNAVNRPRLNLEYMTGADFSGPRGVEIPASLAFTVGDPLGLIDAGPLVRGGVALGEKSAFLDLGFKVHLGEGALGVRWGKKKYFDEARWGWEMAVTTDPLAVLRYLNLGVDREF